MKFMKILKFNFESRIGYDTYYTLWESNTFTINKKIWKKIYVYTSSIKSNIVDEIYENFKM
jgi:hypothetical protein